MTLLRKQGYTGVTRPGAPGTILGTTRSNHESGFDKPDCVGYGGRARHRTLDCPGAGRLLALLVLFETMGGTIATVLGGSIGEEVGLKQFALRYQRRKRAEKSLD